MQIAMHTIRKRIRALAFGLAATGMVFANVASVAAADLTAASLELSDPRPDETSVTYTFSAASFTTGTTINCVTLEFNDAADMGGSVPNSMSTSGYTIDSSTVLTAASWNEDDTTNGLLTNTFVAGETPNASGNIVFGGIENGDTAGTTYFAQLNTYSNVDCSTGGPVDTVTVAYVYIDGQLVQLTVDPTLTFTCTGLSLATDVNGTSTNTSTSCTGIDYDNDVTTSTNGVAGHNLNVTTNANGGYVVYARTTGDLTNQSSDTIDNHSGSNAAPASFPAAGTEAWGYTTEDSTLGGGTADRFTNPANGWAAFTGSNEEIMDDTNATPGAGDDVEVAHQVGIAADTEAGLYQTTLIYTVVATF